MTKITYILPNGTEKLIDVPNGQSVMEGSTRNNLPGIVAECGGSCSCATCHVYVETCSTDRFSPTTTEEEDLLEFLEDRTEGSRLSCQLIVSPTAEGARVKVAYSNG